MPKIMYEYQVNPAESTRPLYEEPDTSVGKAQAGFAEEVNKGVVDFIAERSILDATEALSKTRDVIRTYEQEELARKGKDVAGSVQRGDEFYKKISEENKLSGDARTRFDLALASERDRTLNHFAGNEAKVHQEMKLEAVADIQNQTVRDIDGNRFATLEELQERIKKDSDLQDGLLPGQISKAHRAEYQTGILNKWATARILQNPEATDVVVERLRATGNLSEGQLTALSEHGRSLNERARHEREKFLAEDKSQSYQMVSLTGQEIPGTREKVLGLQGEEGVQRYDMAVKLHQMAYKKMMEAKNAEYLGTSIKDSITSAATTGVPLSGLEDKIADPKRRAMYIQQRDFALESYKITEKVGQATPEEIQEMAKELQPAPGEEGYAMKYARWEHFMNSLHNRQQTLLNDPVKYVLGTKIPQLGDTRTPEGIQRNIETRIDAQKRVGLVEEQVQILTKDEAKFHADRINSLSGNQRADALASIDKTYGQYADQVRREIYKNGLNSDALLMMYADPTTESPIRGRMAESSKVKTKELTDLIGPNEVKDVKAEVDARMQDYLEAVQIGSGSTIAEITGLKQAIYHHAFYEVSQGKSAKDAARQTADVVLSKFSVQDTYVIPLEPGYDVRKITLGLEDYVDYGYSEEKLRLSETDKELNRSELKWLSLPDGSGVILIGRLGTPIFRADGTPVTKSFKELSTQTIPERPGFFSFLKPRTVEYPAQEDTE